MKYMLLILMFHCSGCVIPYSVKVPTFTGKVLGVENAPVEVATIGVEGYPETETTTDAEGTFKTSPTSFKRVFSIPLGDRMEIFNLMIEAEGYEPKKELVTVFRQDEVKVEPISLIPQ